MMDSGGNPRAQLDPQRLTVLLILWGAFLMSHLMMGGVALFLRQLQSVGSDLPAEVIYLFVGIGSVTPFMGAALQPILVASAKRRLHAKGGVDDEQGLSQAFVVQSIIRFALGDVGAVTGLVVMLLSGSVTLWAIPAGLGFASIFLALPTRDRFDALRRDLR